MQRIVSVEALADYRLRITFDDGISGIVSIADRLFGSVFEPLRDSKFFSQAFVDEFGVICWPNGADLAPDALYEKIRQPADLTAK
jgi:hypothetical protein